MKRSVGYYTTLTLHTSMYVSVSRRAGDWEGIGVAALHDSLDSEKDLTGTAYCGALAGRELLNLLPLSVGCA